MYGLGSYEESADQQVTGSLISIPIILPDEYVLDRFYASTNTSNGGAITFDILDSGKNILADDVDSGDNISGYVSGKNGIRLRATFTGENSSSIAILYRWSLTMGGTADTDKPIFFENGFSHKNGWINTLTPRFEIPVQDTGQGLKVSSAEYTLEYKLKNQSGTQINTFKATCSGSNGTTSKETITADISDLEFKDNITDISRIKFYIMDEASNDNYTSWFNLKFDDQKPFSNISNGDDIPYKFNSESVEIEAEAGDNVSGIDTVALYYRDIDNDDWTLFGYDNETPYNWSFSVSSGEYEICSVATDLAGNIEDFPDEGDVIFIFDPNPPNTLSFEDVYWFSSISGISINFSDDFKLDTIAYKPEFDTDWTIIATGINKSLYNEAWKLSEEDWNYMQEGQIYKIYFNVTDICGNKYVSDALQIAKDSIEPHIDVDMGEFAEWQWDNVFGISLAAYDGDGSGVKKIQIEYRYSEDNVSWSNWSVYETYEDGFTSAPFTCEFKADEGNGYYLFKIIAEDYAGNTEELIVSASVSIFPVILVEIMGSLMAILLVTTVILLIKWRKIRKTRS